MLSLSFLTSSLLSSAGGGCYVALSVESPSAVMYISEQTGLHIAGLVDESIKERYTYK